MKRSITQQVHDPSGPRRGDEAGGWFVADAAAETMPISPESPITLASRSTSLVPIADVEAWLMNRLAGKLGTFTIGADNTVLLGPPTVFTSANINNFNF